MTSERNPCIHQGHSLRTYICPSKHSTIQQLELIVTPGYGGWNMQHSPNTELLAQTVMVVLQPIDFTSESWESDLKVDKLDTEWLFKMWEHLRIRKGN